MFLNNLFFTEYLSLMHSYDFMPILRPTRVSATSATLLDHIWINDILDVDETGRICRIFQTIIQSI